MKCKFEHGGCCCNSGCLRYKTTCYPELCGCVVPMSHGDAFRAQSYELVSEKPFNHGNSMHGGIRKALRCIEQTPTVDAVPVVRCRECKYHHDCGTHFCDALRMDCPDDSEFFCAYGERKKGAD